MNDDKQLPVRKDFRRAFFCCAIIAGTTLIAFLPSLNNGFTNLDDDKYVADNPDIKGVTLHNLSKIFSSSYVGNYQPFSMLTYMAEYSLFTLNPKPYHATNLLLHIVNGCLVVMLIYGLSGSYLTGLLVGLLFAVHPMRVESVAWIAERKDVLSALFYFVSLLFYLRYINKNKRKFYWLCALSFLFSLLSKPMAVSLPVVLLLIDYLNNRKLNKEAILNKIPFFALSAVFCVITLLTQLAGSKSQYINFSLFHQVFAPFYGIVFYLLKTAFPVSLCAFYPFPAVIPLRLLVSPFLVIGIAAAVWCFRTKSRTLVFGSLFFLITALPVLQIVRVGNAIVAERYTYVPLLGIYFIFAALVTFLFKEKFGNKKAAKTLLLSGVTALLIAFTFMTQKQCRVWKDSFSLWNDVIRKLPSEVAYTSRGAAYSTIGEYDRAIEDHAHAIKINPDYALAYYNRGVAYCDKGDYDHAIEDHTHAINISPTYTEAYINRGDVYLRKGDFDRAIEDYSEAIKISPSFMFAYFNRGQAYCNKGDYDRAIEDYSEAIKISPSFISAYCNRGLIYCNKGDYDRAIEDHTRAIRLNPEYAQAYNNRGIAYCRRGDYGKAIVDITEAIRLNPKKINSYYNRGLVYKAKGDDSHALDDFKKACDLGFDPACKLLRGN